jgi:hypothetical protein
MTIFAPDDRPSDDDAISDDTNLNAVELGLKFRSNTDGIIAGVRFYKGGPANGGTHVGHLWNISNPTTPLGTVAFTDETESGWQQATFQTPVPIMAGETYVVSYLAPLKNYAATQHFFLSGKDNGPLHALGNDEPPDPTGNGVFKYYQSPPPIPIDTAVFPDGSFNSANYWADVVFSDQAQPAPQVLSTTPEPGTIDVLTAVTPTATFSEALVSTSLTPSTVMLTDTAGATVLCEVSYSPSTFTVTLTPQTPLQPGQAYTVTLKGGTGGIADSTGTPLAADFTWSFTTAPPPPPLIGSLLRDRIIPVLISLL